MLLKSTSNILSVSSSNSLQLSYKGFLGAALEGEDAADAGGGGEDGGWRWEGRTPLGQN